MNSSSLPPQNGTDVPPLSSHSELSFSPPQDGLEELVKGVKSEESPATDVEIIVHSEGDSAACIESMFETSSRVLSNQYQPMLNGPLSPPQSQSQLRRPEQFFKIREIPCKILF